MKKLGLLVMAGALVPLIIAFADPDPAQATSQAATNAARDTADMAKNTANRTATNATNKAVGKMSNKVVPPGKTYAVIDDKGKKMKEFTAGQKTNMTTDCVQVDCPKSFSSSVVCWKCEPRVKAK